MKLYFSNSNTFFKRQNDPSNSLGGYMSSTTIPNLKLNGIFSDVSMYGKMVKSKECLAIFVYNDGITPIANLTLQQIYPNLFGSNINQCEFEYAAVEPTIKSNGDIIMDHISGLNDEPYNVEWFTPTTKRENTVVTVLTPGAIGDAIIFLDVEIDLTGTTIVSLIDDIVLAFKDNVDFTVLKKTDTTIYVERKALVTSGDPVEIISPDAATSDLTNLSGFVDGDILLIEELAPKAALGIWIKRTVLEIKPCATSCIDLSCTQNSQENLELIFSFD